MKKTKLLFVPLIAAGLAGCIALRGVQRTDSLLVQPPIGTATYEVVRAGEPSKHPIRGGPGEYQVVRKHIESQEGDYCVYSATFCARRSASFLPVLFGGTVSWFQYCLAIVRFVEQDGAGFTVLVRDVSASFRLIPTDPVRIEIEADGSAYALEASIAGTGSCYGSSSMLNAEVLDTLENARTLTIDGETLDDRERLTVQSFLADTADLSCEAP